MLENSGATLSDFLKEADKHHLSCRKFKKISSFQNGKAQSDRNGEVILTLSWIQTEHKTNLMFASMINASKRFFYTFWLWAPERIEMDCYMECVDSQNRQAGKILWNKQTNCNLTDAWSLHLFILWWAFNCVANLKFLQKEKNFGDDFMFHMIFTFSVQGWKIKASELGNVIVPKSSQRTNYELFYEFV